jgi:hypothetical protein
LPFALLGLVVGCDTGPKANYDTAEVSGKVFFKGKALPGGRVTFVSDVGGVSGGADIDEQGNYKVEKAPVGPVHITIDNRALNKRPGTKAPHLSNPNAPPPSVMPGVYVPIPKEYYTAEETKLTYTVESVPQTHDIKLE